MLDLIIRNGTVMDGTGGEPFEADVAIAAGRIAAVGKIADRGAEEIDARGLLVTPGFVDPHTHYDGQATWSSRITPSSWNGVTTTLFGNCGVGFAPCKPSQREMLVKLMEGVEEIRKTLPVPRQAFGQHDLGNVLHALHQFHQHLALRRLARR